MGDVFVEKIFTAGLESKEVRKLLEVNDKNVPFCSISNFLTVLRNDKAFQPVCFDTMREAPIIVHDLHKRELWTDKDFARARLYFETEYKMMSKNNLQDAFSVFCTERPYSPIQEIIKSIEWDGVERCDTFFIKWAKSPDDEYSRECGRLFFAQGIARAFEPGSKCDSVVVLMGKQGNAKTTLVKWLAIDKDFYLSLTSIKGKDALQALCGKWIVELEELLATVDNNTSAEEVKQFISNEIDTFRPPYARYPVDHLRSCVFVGTTNRQKFLSDPTGNRRWFPLENNQDGNFLYDHESECKADIMQCWAEMYHYWYIGSEKAHTYPNRNMMQLIQSRQSAAEEDDPELGLIEEYLKHKEKVCLADVCDHALNIEWRKLTQKQRNAISAKLTGNRIGCKVKLTKNGYKPSQDRFGAYGMQQAYIVPERLRYYAEQDETD